MTIDIISHILSEASVQLPPRGRIYIAIFRGPDGEQTSKSTGTTDYETAILVARMLEAEARKQWLQRPRRPKRNLARYAVLTQAQIARMLKISERTVRNDERRVGMLLAATAINVRFNVRPLRQQIL